MTPTDTSRGDALRRSLISTHPLIEASEGTFVSPLEREGAEGKAVAGQPTGQHLSGARRRRGRVGPRGGHRAPRSSGARAREPRQPVRQHGDRGGAAAPRADAQRRRARSDLGPGSSRQGDDRSRRGCHRGRHHEPARQAHLQGAGRGRRRTGVARAPADAARRHRRDQGRERRSRPTARPSASETRSSCGPGPRAMSTTRSSTVARRPSSGSTGATTIASTSG